MPRPFSSAVAVLIAGCPAFALGALLAMPFAPVATADPNPGLLLERAITLKGVSGRIDHMAIDVGRNRLFVAELGNNTLDVIDVHGGRSLHRIAGLREPQGVAYLRQADLVAVANGRDGSVRL